MPGKIKGAKIADECRGIMSHIGHQMAYHMSSAQWQRAPWQAGVLWILMLESMLGWAVTGINASEVSFLVYAISHKIFVEMFWTPHNSNISIQENAFENVCKMVATSSWPQCVKESQLPCFILDIMNWGMMAIIFISWEEIVKEIIIQSSCLRHYLIHTKSNPSGGSINIKIMADSRLAPSQWETLLQSNASLIGRVLT